MSGDWAQAVKHCEQCPLDDGPAQFLLQYLRENTKPSDWKGIIALPK
jgi:hypothetical protein